MDANQFIVDFSDEFTREELVEMIDHSLATICMLPMNEDVAPLIKSIAEPLLLLHLFFYYQKRNSKRP